jgi:hypothetical protein
LNTISVMGLAILTFISIIATVPLSKPTPVVTIQLFSQPIKFTTWNDTIVFSSSSTYSCSDGLTIPGTILIDAANFTENLSGRDPGSTWVHSTPLGGGGGIVFAKSDVTLALITDFLCQGFTIAADKAKGSIGPGGTWRVLSSGDYTVLNGYIAYYNIPTATVGKFTANDTWTVTSIT